MRSRVGAWGVPSDHGSAAMIAAVVAPPGHRGHPSPPPRSGSRTSRWPAGRLTDLCGAMSALARISSASPPGADLQDDAAVGPILTRSRRSAEMLTATLWLALSFFRQPLEERLQRALQRHLVQRGAECRMVLNHPQSSNRHRKMDEAVQPRPPASSAQHAPTCPRNSTTNWPMKMGLYWAVRLQRIVSPHAHGEG